MEWLVDSCLLRLPHVFRGQCDPPPGQTFPGGRASPNITLLALRSGLGFQGRVFFYAFWGHSAKMQDRCSSRKLQKRQRNLGCLGIFSWGVSHLPATSQVCNKLNCFELKLTATERFPSNGHCGELWWLSSWWTPHWAHPSSMSATSPPHVALTHGP